MNGGLYVTYEISIIYASVVWNQHFFAWKKMWFEKNSVFIHRVCHINFFKVKSEKNPFFTCI